MNRWSLATLALTVGCGPAQKPLTVVTDQAIDAPLRGCSDAELERFAQGDALFDLSYRAADGLGPLYIRTKCAGCHEDGANGPGGVQKMVMLQSDGSVAADQTALAYGKTARPFTAGGGSTPIAPPAGNVKVTLRLGPAVYGRGYLEAISEDEVLRVAAQQALRGDGISGRVNRVGFDSEANPDSVFGVHQRGERGLLGRFGVKARIATIDDFTADAFQGDMGLTTLMRPVELPNPDGLADDAHAGVDVDLETVNAVADYLRLLEIPTRAAPKVGARETFDAAQCSACHVPSLRTRDDYPIAALAGIDAMVFTDLLLHDMGAALNDGQAEADAAAAEFKTAPLIGLRFFRAFLHDGRAESVRDAILMHRGDGSEANGSVAAFEALSETDQSLLVEFVESL